MRNRIAMVLASMLLGATLIALPVQAENGSLQSRLTRLERRVVELETKTERFVGHGRYSCQDGHGFVVSRQGFSCASVGSPR